MPTPALFAEPASDFPFILAARAPHPLLPRSTIQKPPVPGGVTVAQQVLVLLVQVRILAG